jgi:hypothetical protein
MRQGLRSVRVFFVLSCLLAAVLVLLVLLTPWLDQDRAVPANWLETLLALFARDAVVRRISLAGAVGLAVTAFVFFRPARPEPTSPRQSSPRQPRQPPPPRTMAGA